MDIYVIIENGIVTQRVEGFDNMRTKFLDSIKEGKVISFRLIQFDDLTDNEKADKMKNKLNSLRKYLEDMRGSGRTYYSHTTIELEELSWLLKNTEDNLNSKNKKNC